jgi:hypothetical protein
VVDEGAFVTKPHQNKAIREVLERLVRPRGGARIIARNAAVDHWLATRSPIIEGRVVVAPRTGR